MSLSRAILDLLATPLLLRRRHRPQRHTADPRILVIRRNRIGDMVYTLPLLNALRRHFPSAHIAVACDPAGAPVAQSCRAVNEVAVLQPGWNPWQAAFKNAGGLQDFDWVIAAKGGFDRRLAFLTRLTNAAIRIGFERRGTRHSLYFTDPVELPEGSPDEHQGDTIMRLLRPLGLVKPTDLSIDLRLDPPEAARAFAAETLANPPFIRGRPFLLINLSSTVPLKFREEDFIALAGRVLGSTDFIVGLVGAPVDQGEAHEIAACMGSKRIAAIETPSVLELAALLEHAALLVTPEGGAAHLAAALDTPAVILWSEGPFNKWYSRGKRHTYVHAQAGEKVIPVERVWQALQPHLTVKQEDVEQKWANTIKPPPLGGTGL